MKSIQIPLAALGLALLVSACAPQAPASQSTPEAPEPATLTGRIVLVQDGTALLAGQEDGGIYTLPLANTAWTLDGDPFDPQAPETDSALPGGSLAGALATVTYSGGMMERYPMQLGRIQSIALSQEGFDNLCGLYLTVLKDLWNVDSALNDGLTQLGVDLSQTRLSESEQTAVAWAFGQYAGLSPIQGTFAELAEQGYITGQPADGDPDGPPFWQWEDGCLFSIRESEEPVALSLPAMAPGDPGVQYDAVRFDAEKWRSSLGAYLFTDCTAVSAGGCWNHYTIGSEAIS